MESLLQSIQPLLTDWQTLTLANPTYAVALAVMVGLLVSLLYSVRISGLKKTLSQNQQLAGQLQTQIAVLAQEKNLADQNLQEALQTLKNTQSQVQQAQDNTEQVRQWGQALQALLIERDQHLASAVQLMANCFDIGEPLVSASDNNKTDDLWQQHNRVINQMLTALRTESQAKWQWKNNCQAEMAKTAEKETELQSLQSKLNTQALAFEQSVQEKDHAHAVITEAYQTEIQKNYSLQKQMTELAGSQIEVARLQTALEAQAVELTDLQNQLKQAQSQRLTPEPQAVPVTQTDAPEKTLTEPAHQEVSTNQAQPEQIEEPTAEPQQTGQGSNPPELASPTPDSEPVEKTATDQTIATDVTPQQSAAKGLGFVKNLLGKKQLPPAEPETEIAVSAPATLIEPANEEPTVPAAEAKPAPASLGFAKNLFGKKPPESAEPEIVEESLVEPTEAKPAPASLGFVKNLFGKKPPESAEPEIVEESVVESAETQPASASLGFAKNLFGKKPPESAEPEIVEESVVKPAEAKPASASLGFAKNLFGKKPPESAEPEIVEESLVEPAEAKPAPASLGFTKKLFGKKPPKTQVEPPVPVPEAEPVKATPSKNTLGYFKNLLAKLEPETIVAPPETSSSDDGE